MSPGRRRYKDMEGFLIRGWNPIVPGWRWLYSRAPISDRPEWLGFPHRARRCPAGGSPFSSPGCRSCRYMEMFLNRGWGAIIPGCGEIVGFPRGVTPTARAARPHWPRVGGRCASARLGLGPTVGTTTHVTQETNADYRVSRVSAQQCENRGSMTMLRDVSGPFLVVVWISDRFGGLFDAGDRVIYCRTMWVLRRACGFRA